MTITYDGLGQADSTFVGQCSHNGPATTLSGTAGSATVDLVFDPSTVTLTVTDVGLGTSRAALARVDLTVVGGRLTLNAPLVSARGRHRLGVPGRDLRILTLSADLDDGPGSVPADADAVHAVAVPVPVNAVSVGSP